mmetsp:Transcript_11651/g.29667  ORF Transcript_11651/g.29667 Transcript_11651/m.29667 type:complete len:395 (+) Transcript_11651:698-1882(+)
MTPPTALSTSPSKISTGKACISSRRRTPKRSGSTWRSIKTPFVEDTPSQSSFRQSFTRVVMPLKFSLCTTRNPPTASAPTTAVSAMPRHFATQRRIDERLGMLSFPNAATAAVEIRLQQSFFPSTHYLCIEKKFSTNEKKRRNSPPRAGYAFALATCFSTSFFKVSIRSEMVKGWFSSFPLLLLLINPLACAMWTSPRLCPTSGPWVFPVNATRSGKKSFFPFKFSSLPKSLTHAFQASGPAATAAPRVPAWWRSTSARATGHRSKLRAAFSPAGVAIKSSRGNESTSRIAGTASATVVRPSRLIATNATAASKHASESAPSPKRHALSQASHTWRARVSSGMRRMCCALIQSSLELSKMAALLVMRSSENVPIKSALEKISFSVPSFQPKRAR